MGGEEERCNRVGAQSDSCDRLTFGARDSKLNETLHKRVTQRYAMQRQRCDSMQHSSLAVPTLFHSFLSLSLLSAHSFYAALLSPFSLHLSHDALDPWVSPCSLHSTSLSPLILSTFPSRPRWTSRSIQPPFLRHQTRLVAHRCTRISWTDHG